MEWMEAVLQLVFVACACGFMVVQISLNRLTAKRIKQLEDDLDKTNQCSNGRANGLDSRLN